MYLLSVWCAFGPTDSAGQCNWTQQCLIFSPTHLTTAIQSCVGKRNNMAGYMHWGHDRC